MFISKRSQVKRFRAAFLPMHLQTGLPVRCTAFKQLIYEGNKYISG